MGTTTQNVVQETKLPDWYAQYLQQVMGRAVGAAGEPYQQYTGQLNAGQTSDQIGAADIVRGVASGAATPWLTAANDQYNAAAAGNSGEAGQGSFDQASGLFQQGAGVDTASQYQPYGQQAAGLAGAATAQANPYIQQSTSPMGLNAAAPFLGAASQTFPGAAQDYMSPYTQQVTDRIAQLGGRNLSENLLPQISDQFVRAGQFGSAQQRDVVGRALRDTQESVLGQQAQALEQGYSTAGQLFGQDQSRLAGLAGTAGGLGAQQQQTLQGAGNSLGSLGLSQAGLVSNIGSTGAGLSAADAQRQITAGQGLSGIGQSQVQASQADLQRQLAAGQSLAALGLQGQNMSLQGAAALENVGASQQAQQQRGLDTAYSQFQQQQNYPWQQIGNLSNVIQGLPVGQSTNTSQTTTTPNASPISQVAGLGIGAAGLAQSGIFKAKGGAVHGKQVKYKRSHSYGNTPRRGIAVFDEAA